VGYIAIPSKSLFDFVDSSALLRTFATKRNKRGKSGHPWRSPHYALKKGEAKTFISTTKEAEEIQHITHLIKLISKPRWVKSRRMYS